MLTKEQSKNLLSESKFYKDYSRWNSETQSMETWDEAVDRVISMHKLFYKDKLSEELENEIDFAAELYKQKRVLGAQRALQFGGEQLFKHHARNYNCSYSHIDRLEFFQECMYLLLCGCGVGFSVQKQHIEKLPKIKQRYQKKVKVFTIPDSIEGWADAFGVLISSYVVENPTFPDYQGYQVHFDFSKIRPKGSDISGGFKAPGSESLRSSLLKCEALLENIVCQSKDPQTINSITAYDFVMHMSDAVLSGGVRRSATICLFSKDDESMLKAKTGNWFIDNPQRGRSNNSIVLLRDSTTKEEFFEIIKSVKDFGEPGFIWTDNLEFGFNPCVEVGLFPVIENRTGFQFCNLTEINGGVCDSEDKLYKACRAATVLGTLQAGYTDFKYINSVSKEITERESLIGVGITGWMNNPDILFDDEVMEKAAEIVKAVNKKIAKLIGINQAARTTVVKPSGNASVILGCDSGIHGAHSERYFRNVQMNHNDNVAEVIQKINPKMVEKSVWSSNNTDVVVSFPIVSPEGSYFKKNLLGVKQLEYVKKAQQVWIEKGTNLDLCAHPKLRHNVSNTITVDDWEEVQEYIYENRYYFAGISLLSSYGDKAYAQAPFTEVLTADEILSLYGEASMFASGLIVDALHAFDNNLWLACDTVLGTGLVLTEGSSDLLKRDWIRRANKFAVNYFDGNVLDMTFCLKDCQNLHKWEGIMRSSKDINFSLELKTKNKVDADSLGSQACSGGACEITF